MFLILILNIIVRALNIVYFFRNNFKPFFYIDCVFIVLNPTLTFVKPTSKSCDNCANTGDNWIFCSLFFTWYSKIWIKNHNSYIMLYSKETFLRLYFTIARLLQFFTKTEFQKKRNSWDLVNVEKYHINPKIYCNQILTFALIFPGV